MKNEQIIFPIIEQFYNKIQNKEFVTDKSGVKCVEIIGAKIENLNPKQAILDFGIKKTNKEYCEKELKWYLSRDLNISDWVDDISIWKQVADYNGFINSNYGWCIFSEENYNQYENCKKELIKNPQSRRAIMIYNRPNMWIDYNKDGRSDFICTLQNQFFIRDNTLISIYEMRSNDLIYGWFNDFYWACEVYNKLFEELKMIYKDLKLGTMTWIANSLHVYEKHFELLEKTYTNNYANSI